MTKIVDECQCSLCLMNVMSGALQQCIMGIENYSTQTQASSCRVRTQFYDFFFSQQFFSCNSRNTEIWQQKFVSGLIFFLHAFFSVCNFCRRRPKIYCCAHERGRESEMWNGWGEFLLPWELKTVCVLYTTHPSSPLFQPEWNWMQFNLFFMLMPFAFFLSLVILSYMNVIWSRR